MSTLFVLKMSGFFFQKCRKKWTKLCEIHPPPSLSISKQHRISILEIQNTVHVSFTLLEGGGGVRRMGGGGGGGGLSRMCLKPCSPLVEKNAGTFSADSEQLEKSL